MTSTKRAPIGTGLASLLLLALVLAACVIFLFVRKLQTEAKLHVAKLSSKPAGYFTCGKTTTPFSSGACSARCAMVPGILCRALDDCKSCLQTACNQSCKSHCKVHYTGAQVSCYK